jgi:hypothetical protein
MDWTTLMFIVFYLKLWDSLCKIKHTCSDLQTLYVPSQFRKTTLFASEIEVKLSKWFGSGKGLLKNS